jgi:hypothetical protein
MLRFSIRDLIWLMLVVALAVAWWVERRQQQQVNADLRREQERLTVENDKLRLWQLDLGTLMDPATRRMREP